MAINAREQEHLLDVLKIRFEKNSHRHEGIDWAHVHARLIGNPAALMSLQESHVRATVTAKSNVHLK